jgi:hypothetical protein
MPGLLDFLGLGGGLQLDPVGENAGIGILDPETLKRMRRMAGYTGDPTFGPRPVIGTPAPAAPAAPMDPNAVPPAVMPQSIGLGGGAGQTVTSTGGREPGPAFVPPGSPFPVRSNMEFSGVPPGAVPPAAPGLLSSGGGVAPGFQSVSPGYSGYRGGPSLPSSTSMLEDRPRREPGAPLPATASAPDLLGRVGDFLQKHSNVFLGIGAGFGGARSLSEGLGRASAGVSAGQRADVENQAYNSTIDALMQRGMSRTDAEAIAGQPTLLKQVTQQIFPQPEFKTITDAAGNQRLVLVNPGRGTVTQPTAGPQQGQTGSFRGREAIFMDGKWYYPD